MKSKHLDEEGHAAWRRPCKDHLLSFGSNAAAPSDRSGIKRDPVRVEADGRSAKFWYAR
jgi:hypothetical protein